jgi:hypothetical protein
MNLSGPAPIAERPASQRWRWVMLGLLLVCLLIAATIRMPRPGPITIEYVGMATNQQGARELAYRIQNPKANALSLHAYPAGAPGMQGSWERIQARSTNQFRIPITTNKPPYRFEVTYFEDVPRWLSRTFLFVESFRETPASGVSFSPKTVQLPEVPR